MVPGENRKAEKTGMLVWSNQDDSQNEGVPWGPFRPPFYLTLEEVKISMEEKGNNYIYRREGGGEKADKIIVAEPGILRLCPVEPLPKPPGLSAHLLIDFARPVVMEPRAEKSIYVLFPLSIAAIIENRSKEDNLLDLFSLNKSKYTLYGNVREGLICRYWKSEIYESIPPFNPFKLGILQIEIKNSTAKWAEVNEAVFSAYGMKIYFSPNLVTLNAVMKIAGDQTAETTFIDKPIRSGMLEAWRQFSPKPLNQQGRTIMGEGY
ncbi:MAG: hypothetical protein AVO34_02540 [Firmicutes bacterium ML8_F2]|nr:MAG: hypothetical protein AVO34_02540 [Firmicutes bacterium ML8_F2]